MYWRATVKPLYDIFMIVCGRDSPDAARMDAASALCLPTVPRQRRRHHLSIGLWSMTGNRCAAWAFRAAGEQRLQPRAGCAWMYDEVRTDREDTDRSSKLENSIVLCTHKQLYPPPPQLPLAAFQRSSKSLTPAHNYSPSHSTRSAQQKHPAAFAPAWKASVFS
jgi:hypothetical protein